MEMKKDYIKFSIFFKTNQRFIIPFKIFPQKYGTKKYFFDTLNDYCTKLTKVYL